MKRMHKSRNDQTALKSDGIAEGSKPAAGG